MLNQIKISFADEAKESIAYIPVEKLKPYKEQPFKRLSAERFEELKNSIAEVGVLNPLIVRKKEQFYEMLSGANRAVACARLKIPEVPAIIKKCSDSEAMLILTDCNLRQRDKILPSERAKAYQMQYNAVKQQGRKSSAQNEQKHDAGDIVAKRNGTTSSDVRRYIRLTNLNKELLSAVDGKQLSLVAAVTLSYLSAEHQKLVYDYFFINNKIQLDTKKAKNIRTLADKNNLNEDSLNELVKVVPKQTTVNICVNLECLKGKINPETLPSLVHQLLSKHADSIPELFRWRGDDIY